jgi:hypothetical protein
MSTQAFIDAAKETAAEVWPEIQPDVQTVVAYVLRAYAGNLKNAGVLGIVAKSLLRQIADELSPHDASAVAQAMLAIQSKPEVQ